MRVDNFKQTLKNLQEAVITNTNKETKSIVSKQMQRLIKNDIDLVKELNVPWIGLFFDINEDHLEKKYGLNEEKALEMIMDSISYAKRHKLNVRFTAEDASRTNFEVLIKIAKLIEKAGADRFSFADTVGVLHPAKVSNIFSRASIEWGSNALPLLRIQPPSLREKKMDTASQCRCILFQYACNPNNISSNPSKQKETGRKTR